ncbi:MAG: preprotein translocase subunit SecG [Candidatus Eisenbacteria bacterium]|uniref:Protein-export membrane protein SecG n=1 Tax=Eiseniibacteriota bacterium TaxID=2212470 RepID=A0A933SFI0_UNCEI|nr:preprotein translocase subunit SecG [Candidatus Eisenbacteria bacterium]
MYGVVLAFHLLVCLALIGVILIQSGKGGGLAGGAFGGATQTVFGGRGATDFITKATIYLGVIFFVTSLGLAILTSKGGPGGSSKSIMQEEARRNAAKQTQSQAPGRTPAPAGAPAPTGASGAAGAPSNGAK